MFEKEAEKLAEEYIDEHSPCFEEFPKANRGDLKKAFQEGFEKGIKAKLNSTTISDCPIFEPKWHKIAVGDLPTEDLRARTLGYYLTASKSKFYKGLEFEVAYFTGVVFIRGGYMLDDVVAWCEIPEPKL